MSWEHWGPWTRKVLTRRKEKTIEVIEKTQLGCGRVFFFDQKVGLPNKIKVSVMKIIKKSLKQRKLTGKAGSGWI
jgi:hypothetical protein